VVADDVETYYLKQTVSRRPPDEKSQPWTSESSNVSRLQRSRLTLYENRLIKPPHVHNRLRSNLIVR